MNPLKKLFQQTFVYGLATVLPKIFNFLLTPLHTDVMSPEVYGDTSLLFSWIVIFNVLLAYGMETTFFRFFHKEDNKKKVVGTSLTSIVASTFLFVLLALLFGNQLADYLSIGLFELKVVIGILALDALAIVPFAWLRANEKPKTYTWIKISSVLVNLGLNYFFLIVLPGLANSSPDSFWASIYLEDFQLAYVFIANLIGSAMALVCLLGTYLKFKFTFDKALWNRMMRYAYPILIAGLAFAVNEVFDRILLSKMLPFEEARAEIGKYSACYKLGMFMALFSTAFRLGVEPFFFKQAQQSDPQKRYAQITTYFVIMGSAILLATVVFSDLLKVLFIKDERLWEAMKIVPLILLANFCLGIYHNLSVWYKVTDKTRYGAAISVIGALVTLGINFFFIPVIGYMASAIATLSAYGAMMMLSYYLGRSRYPIPYNLRKILFYSGISILFSALSFYVFDRDLIIGGLMLFVFLALVYKLEGSKIKSIFLQ